MFCYVGSEATASPVNSKVPNQPTGRSFMGNVMDTLMLKNTTFRSVRGKPVEADVNNSLQVMYCFNTENNVSLLVSLF